MIKKKQYTVTEQSVSTDQTPSTDKHIHLTLKMTSFRLSKRQSLTTVL